MKTKFRFKPHQFAVPNLDQDVKKLELVIEGKENVPMWMRPVLTREEQRQERVDDYAILLHLKEEGFKKEKILAEKAKTRRDELERVRQEKLVDYLRQKDDKLRDLVVDRAERLMDMKSHGRKSKIHLMRFSATESAKSSGSAGTHEMKGNSVAFGSKSGRFSTIGYHPSFETTGCLRNDPAIGPANYLPEYNRKKCTGTINWAHSAETNKFSKTLGNKIPRILKERIWNAGGLGPAIHDIPLDPDRKSKSGSVLQNAGFTLAPRFPRNKHNATAGPGRYGMVDKPRGHGFNKMASFEWSGYHERSGMVAAPRFHLPPNLYHYKDPDSIAEKMKHSISKRGPYDLFTGPRDNTTLTGHMVPSKDKGCGAWPYDAPVHRDKYTNSNIGKWSEGPRFPRAKDPNYPGPAAYDPKIPEYRMQEGKKYPFSCSQLHARPILQCNQQPGVGRYTPLFDKYINCHESVFKSKDKRSQWMYKETMNRY